MRGPKWRNDDDRPFPDRRRELSAVRSFRQLVLTDGERSDIDVPDSLDLVEDSSRAVLGLRARHRHIRSAAGRRGGGDRNVHVRPVWLCGVAPAGGSTRPAVLSRR